MPWGTAKRAACGTASSLHAYWAFGAAPSTAVDVSESWPGPWLRINYARDGRGWAPTPNFGLNWINENKMCSVCLEDMWQSGRVAETFVLVSKLGSPARHAHYEKVLCAKSKRFLGTISPDIKILRNGSFQWYTQGLGMPSDTPVLSQESTQLVMRTSESYRSHMRVAMPKHACNAWANFYVGAHNSSKLMFAATPKRAEFRSIGCAISSHSPSEELEAAPAGSRPSSRMLTSLPMQYHWVIFKRPGAVGPSHTQWYPLVTYGTTDFETMTIFHDFSAWTLPRS